MIQHGLSPPRDHIQKPQAESSQQPEACHHLIVPLHSPQILRNYCPSLCHRFCHGQCYVLSTDTPALIYCKNMVVVGLKNVNSNTVKPLGTELWPQHWFWIIECIFNLWFHLWCSVYSLKKGSEENLFNKKKHPRRQQSWVCFLSWMFQFLTCPAVKPCYLWQLSCSVQPFQRDVKFPLNPSASHPGWERGGCRANIYITTLKCSAAHLAFSPADIAPLILTPDGENYATVVGYSAFLHCEIFASPAADVRW